MQNTEIHFLICYDDREETEELLWIQRLFVLITSNMDRTYEEECNMAMDVFLEEEFDMGELKRMLLYLLDKVKADRREMVKEKIEQQIGSLHEQ